jgi:hypothetical protein
MARIFPLLHPLTAFFSLIWLGLAALIFAPTGPLAWMALALLLWLWLAFLAWPQPPRAIVLGLLGVSLALGLLWHVPPLRRQVALPLIANLAGEANPYAVFDIPPEDYALYRQAGPGPDYVLDPRRGVAHPVAFFYPTLADSELDVQNRRSPLGRWRESKYPGYLRQLGVTHLYYDSEWLKYLSDAEYAPLANPDYYRLIAQAEHGGRTVFLYEVLADALPE